MNGRRTTDEHVALFVEFAHRIACLTPEAWDRLNARCAALNGPDFRALLARTALSAAPHKLSIPGVLRDHASYRMLRGVGQAAIASMLFAGAVIGEFEAPHHSSPLRRPRSSGNPVSDVAFLIENVLAPRERAEPGVATAVRAAGHAVRRHDWLSSQDFETVYRYLEPDIPFAELQPPANVEP
jgi:hypothetical protein